MNKKSPILIIGSGSIGSRHLRNLIALGYKNVSVVDAKTPLERIKKIFSVHCYTNAHDAFQKEKPMVTFVCTPTHLHAKHAHMALDYNSHVFIEKPVSHTMSGIDSLIHDAKKRQLVAMVACNYKFQPGIQKFESILKTGNFGVPLSCRVVAGYYLPDARKKTHNVYYKNIYAARSIFGGGVILDSGSHIVNYLLAFFGTIKKGIVLTGLTNQLHIQSEESAVMHLYHQNGFVSSVWLDFISKKPMHRIEVLTDKGLLTMDAGNDQIFFADAKNSKIIYKGNPESTKSYINEVKHFLDCIQHHKKPIQDLVEAKEVVKILLSLKRM